MNKREVRSMVVHLMKHFVVGVLSVFGFNDTKSLTKKIDFDADDGIRSDWKNVGKDIWKSYEKYKSEYC